MIEVEKTFIEGLLVITPKVYSDNRGYFFESYNKKAFDSYGIVDAFLQDNESLSSKGVLRGLHFQAPPFDQGKLVRVVTGSVLDVAVDIRKGSPTYGKHYSVLLSGDNKKMFWIPPGFAHGFVALEDQTRFLYKCTNVYHQPSEGAIRWDDASLDIDWQIPDPVVSEKDQAALGFSEFITPFVFKK
jgi:dTDP-4-dehydrorhamnose 3,5-epimerase